MPPLFEKSDHPHRAGGIRFPLFQGAVVRFQSDRPYFFPTPSNHCSAAAKWGNWWVKIVRKSM